MVAYDSFFHSRFSFVLAFFQFERAPGAQLCSGTNFVFNTWSQQYFRFKQYRGPRCSYFKNCTFINDLNTIKSVLNAGWKDYSSSNPICQSILSINPICFKSYRIKSIHRLTRTKIVSSAASFFSGLFYLLSSVQRVATTVPFEKLPDFFDSL